MPAYLFFLGMPGDSTAAQTGVSPIVWFVLILVVVLTLLRPTIWASSGGDDSDSTDEDAEADELKERFLDGEIDAATYRRLMARLKAADNAGKAGKAGKADDADYDDDMDDEEESDASSEQRKSALKASTPWTRTPTGIPPGMF